VNKGIAATLIVTLFTVAAWSAGVYRAATSSYVAFIPVTVTEPPAASHESSGWASLPVPLLDEPVEDEQRDLYGNDVSDAVATYKSDPAGSVYEEHSPQTEVPRLKPPTT
jgi:hypothetical protein